MNKSKSQEQRLAKRGFASMSHDRQIEIARIGGASVPTEKRSFYQDRALAAAAGRKGGKARHLARGADAASPHPKEP
jgi:uncharacterized protein